MNFLNLKEMFFNPKHRKTLQIIMTIVAAIMILGMIMLYFPAFQ